MLNFSEALLNRLVALGYTHCFFVAGGNIMHLLNAARTRFNCIPVVHEVSAVIAAEYFNECNNSSRAFVLVTAGPGITNAVTGIAGAWLESREVLIIGGQVKSRDLSRSEVRQRGIQEIDGVEIVSSISRESRRIESPVNLIEIVDLLKKECNARPGPVFLEICIDAQAAPYLYSEIMEEEILNQRDSTLMNIEEIESVAELVLQSSRPVLLIGSGVSRAFKEKLVNYLSELEIPIMTTWNAADRIDASFPYYFGRPNTWGQRYANILIQQTDLLIAVGTRLSLQQTGFNWEQFVPFAKVIHIDTDSRESIKGHPKIHYAFNTDATLWLEHFFSLLRKSKYRTEPKWLEFMNEVKDALPLSESSNISFEGYVNPYDFILELSKELTSSHVIVPCSSGGAFTVFMQAFEQKSGQKIISNKGLASMGYGLAGAIGACLGSSIDDVVLIEGDGGFSQNIQELATVAINNLPIKIIVFENGGYASIRMTQKNYFEGTYIGCDRHSGLGMPNWTTLFQAYGIAVSTLNPARSFGVQIREFINTVGPRALLVPIHEDQTYFPKITSFVTSSGDMVSNPLHLMTPALDEILHEKVTRYFRENS